MSLSEKDIELKREIELVKDTVKQVRHMVNLNLDTILARLRVMETGTNEIGNITDWKAEVDSWDKK